MGWNKVGRGTDLAPVVGAGRGARGEGGGHSIMMQRWRGCGTLELARALAIGRSANHSFGNNRLHTLHTKESREPRKNCREPCRGNIRSYDPDYRSPYPFRPASEICQRTFVRSSFESTRKTFGLRRRAESFRLWNPKNLERRLASDYRRSIVPQRKAAFPRIVSSSLTASLFRLASNVTAV